MDNDTKSDGRKVGTAGESGIRPRSRQQGERGKKMERREWAFVGVDVIALWGMSLQGAKRPQSGKGGGGARIRSASAAEEDGAKTGSETNPPPFSHTDTNSLKSLLPEVLLTVASHPRGS